MKSNKRSEAKISNFSDKIEIDYSHLKARKVGVNKTHVFGKPKHDGKIYTQIIKNYSTNELIPIL